MSTLTQAPRTTSRGVGRLASRADREAATRLGDVVGRLVRMLRRSYVGTLGPASASALATMVREGPVRLGDLAEREGVTPAALSRVVAALERDGLVERAADPEDRRSVFVTATETGRRSVQTMRSARAGALVLRISRLSVAERETLLAGLDVLERLVDDPES